MMRRAGGRSRRHHATASGGAPAFSPVTSVTSATCELWLDAGLGVTTSGGKVTAWLDQSTQGDAARDFYPVGAAWAAEVAANRPTYNATDAAYNNLPTVTFDGVDNRLGNTGGAWSVAMTQPFTIFMVGELDGAVYNDHVINGADAGVLVYVDGTGLLQFAGGAGNYVTQPTSKSAVALEFNGASSKVYVSSTTASVTGAAGAAGWPRLVVGNYVGLDGYGADGKIATILVYKGALDATDRAAVLAYLGDKYGITIA